ncbi:aldo/keto reductase [Pseudomonas sp. NFACC13-1]|uniref:aldo/keto reductase n=1 Tax=Pseudomonas sp. NFACC13-1 TaxID=1566245 RepID=UPI00088BB7CF|nr:aldo/keto reductase [Pseudomonas sp. NFACC13-1]SDB16465.1 Cytidylyltransferase [Pseudomonas sp. NFACC13-1]
MTSVAVLQARTSSSRLPGKVLLPINGIPLAVLAAKRAANTGREVIVATSSLASDDALADVLNAHGLGCFRGSLESPLERIVQALDAYPDNAIVFRLTADNVFPDGLLLDEIEEAFVQGGYEYLCCNGMESGLPYGVSAEVTRLGHLRWALDSAVDAFDTEHVTPLIIRRFGRCYFERYKSRRLGLLRCTVDNLDDYLLVQKVFNSVADAVNVTCEELMQRLEVLPNRPIVAQAADKLVFGTVQLGLNYGVSNTSGRPDLAQACKMLRCAVINGVKYIDTGRAYGTSEAVVGAAFKGGWEGRATVITKLSPLADCPVDADPLWVRAAVDASIFESCHHLETSTLDVVMLHRAAQLVQWQGAAWERLTELRQQGVIAALGVSVQNPVELQRALEEPLVSHIQLPYNLLDWRWDDSISLIEEAKQGRSLTIHVRSALLQGLLVNDNVASWRSAHVDDSATVREWLDNQVSTLGRSSIVDLCFAYLRALTWVDGIAVGMENTEQLLENLELFCKPPLEPGHLSVLQASRPRLTELALNPACWLRD